jgi:hypothetical protein
MVEIKLNEEPLYVTLPIEIETIELSGSRINIRLISIVATKEGEREARINIILEHDKLKYIAKILPGWVSETYINKMKILGWKVEKKEEESGDKKTEFIWEVSNPEKKQSVDIEGDGLGSGSYEYEPSY